MTPKLEIVVSPDEPIISSTRFIDAPPALVFELWTKPEHLRHWWGPRRLSIVECTVNLVVGGGYRIVHQGPDGQLFGFHGTYLEIDAPHRLISTFVFEGAPEHEAVETLTLEPSGHGTLLHTVLLHKSLEGRDHHVENGMEAGMTETYLRLDELAARVHGSRGI